MGLLDGGGILGTGVCFSQECRDRLDAQSKSDAEYKAALANSMNSLAGKKDNTVTIMIIVAVIVVVALLITVFVLTRKKK